MSTSAELELSILPQDIYHIPEVRLCHQVLHPAYCISLPLFVPNKRFIRGLNVINTQTSVEGHTISPGQYPETIFDSQICRVTVLDQFILKMLLNHRYLPDFQLETPSLKGQIHPVRLMDYFIRTWRYSLGAGYRMIAMTERMDAITAYPCTAMRPEFLDGHLWIARVDLPDASAATSCSIPSESVLHELLALLFSYTSVEPTRYLRGRHQLFAVSPAEISRGTIFRVSAINWMGIFRQNIPSVE